MSDPTMGLLDIPAPLLGWLDAWLTPLPVALRVALWGALSGVLSMWCYGLISPQATIARNRRRQMEARERLAAFDGELADAWPLMRDLLGVSLRQVGHVLLPAVAASLPVLCVMVWISTTYGRQFPPADPGSDSAHPLHDSAGVSVTPDRFNGALVLTRTGYRVSVEDPSRGAVMTLPVPRPVPVIEKRAWWNVMIGNPAGYLPASGPVERIEIRLPRRQSLHVGPDWARGWELTFFTALLAASLLAKRVMKLH